MHPPDLEYAADEKPPLPLPFCSPSGHPVPARRALHLQVVAVGTVPGRVFAADGRPYSVDCTVRKPVIPPPQKRAVPEGTAPRVLPVPDCDNGRKVAFPEGIARYPPAAGKPDRDMPEDVLPPCPDPGDEVRDGTRLAPPPPLAAAPALAADLFHRTFQLWRETVINGASLYPGEGRHGVPGRPAIVF